MDTTSEPKKSSSSLKLRVISGLILGPLTLALIVLGGWYFMGLILLALTLSLYEWYKMVRTTDHFIVPFLCGWLYIGFCFASYIFLRFGFEQGAWLALAAMLSIWASDTGAYFIGKKIGGPKLAPKISPNKTWAGFLGALFFAGLFLTLTAWLGSYLNSYIPADLGLHDYHYVTVFFVGVGLGAVGQAGDLLISAFKRRAGIKDTGHLIPGHGGLLDRIDSLLLVSPVFLGFVFLWMM